MTLNAKQKAEIWHHYDTWMTGYLNADVETYDTYFDDDYHFIGSTNNEEFLNRKDTTKFFELTGEQFSGITTLRNETRILEAFGTSVFLTHIFDGWFLHDNEWTYYGRFRFSSVMQKKEAGWRFIYQHFSMPDLKSDEGQTIGYENITAENFELKEAIKRRTIELEVKNKELKIEAALERVRSRSMAMHLTDELQEVVRVVAEELKNTGVILDTWGAVICTYFQDSKDVLHWTASEDPANPSIAFLLPYFKDELYDEAWASKNRGDSYFAKVFSFEVKNAFFNHAFEYSDYQLLPDDYKKTILESESHGIAWAWAKNSAIMIPSIQGDLPSDAEKEILIRFAKVFEQSFIRFLDLQKAEAQAREAQIELALERVRARSMAMQHSEELQDTSLILFDQLKELGEPAEQCTIGIIKELEGVVEISATLHGNIMQQTFRHKIDEPFVMNKIFRGWKDQQRTLVLEIKEEELQKYNQYRNELVGTETFSVKQLPGDRRFIYIAYFSKGMMALSTNEPRPAESLQLLERFATVFDQTYTRFLDLQKAEAQVREAQIEAALERVRSRTMAMYKSDELLEIGVLLFQEVSKLGINIFNCGYVLMDEEAKIGWNYGVNPGDGTIRPLPTGIPQSGTNVLNAIAESWKKQEPFLLIELDPQETIKHQTYMAENMPNFSLTKEELLALSPERIAIHTFNFKHGYILLVDGAKLTADQQEMAIRFAKVFEQTYTRFLDLQRAEAQAREAKIEAALEKVRSRTMGMQSSDELPEVANLLFNEVRALGIHAWSCGYNILSEDKKTAICCMSSEGTLQTPFQLRLWGEASFDEMGDFIRSEKAMLVQELGGKALEEHYAYMKSFPDLKPTFDEIDRLGLSLPTYQINHLCKFTQGFILFITYEKVPDAHDIFKRFTGVFDQTFTRFLDLKKAEAQARESQIELSLERIRSQATSMQQSIDLLDVVVTMRNEFIRLGHEAHYFWHMLWSPDKYEKAMTSGDGTRIGFVMELPRHIHGNIPLLANWEKSNSPSVVYPMDVDAALDYVHKMISLGDFKNIDPNTPSDDDIRHIGGLTFIMARTTHGEIGYSLPGAVANPPAEDLEILVRFAGAFDLAHRRFLDLQKAEEQARETQIELALEKVRNRTMAMQHSDELPEAANHLFLEIQALGLPAASAGYCIWENEDKKSSTAFVSSIGELQKPFSLPTIGIGYDFYNPMLNGEKFLVQELHGQRECAKHYAFMRTLPVFGEVLNGLFEAGFQIPDFQVFHIVYFSQGYLMFITREPVPHAYDIFKRCGNVFEQTYTRFLDLQTKEEQALLIREERDRLEIALNELHATQSQLIQQEKLASLGQLTAGIAHEIKNPLNFVNNFSEVSIELTDELRNELDQVKTQYFASHIASQQTDLSNIDEAESILKDLKSNLIKIHEHGTRANSIVTSMLQHSRGGTGKKEPTELNALVKEYVNLCFHGMRAGKNPINVEVVLDLDPKLGLVSLIREDFTRVVINLCNNAFDAMRQKTLNGPEDYNPRIRVQTTFQNDQIFLSIEDNGPGIPEKIRDKILQPFFTTKKGTEGTGLGLSITNDIVKAHGGELEMETAINKGTSFIIKLNR